MERIWKIAGLNIQQGEKVQTEIPVYDTKTEMSVTFIYGEHPGKTILITSGVHPAESTGIQASIQLAKELSPNIIPVSYTHLDVYKRQPNGSIKPFAG